MPHVYKPCAVPLVFNLGREVLTDIHILYSNGIPCCWNLQLIRIFTKLREREREREKGQQYFSESALISQ